jgi:hypothetical protein
VQNKVTLSGVQDGDGLIFYCSGKYGHRNEVGYWGMATVVGTPFVSNDRVWGDDVYPARIAFTSASLLKSPVTSDQVRQALGGARLRHFRRTSLIRLTPEEYDAISSLIEKARRNLAFE